MQRICVARKQGSGTTLLGRQGVERPGVGGHLATKLELAVSSCQSIAGPKLCLRRSTDRNWYLNTGNGVPNVGEQIAEFLGTGEAITGHLIVLWAGHNDLTGNIEPAVIVANLVQHISTLQENGGRYFRRCNILRFARAGHNAG